MDNLGQNIREKREKKKITVEQLSQKTKISVAVLRDIEAGKFDRYTGDEAYVKMYLKKISQALDMDAIELTQQYVALTQQIELAKLQEQQEKLGSHNEEVVERGKKFTFKVPQLTRKPSIYEDRSHMTIIRAAIILIMICLIVVVFWYGFYSTRLATDDPEFQPSHQTQVEGNITPEEKDPDENQEEPSSPQEQPQDAGITFTRTKKLNYEFKLPEETKEFTVRMDFGKKSWSSLRVNGKRYNDFKERIYHNNDSEEYETVELTFSVDDFKELELKNGYSMGHRYYINGQELVLDERDISEGVSRLKLILVKE